MDQSEAAPTYVREGSGPVSAISTHVVRAPAGRGPALARLLLALLLVAASQVAVGARARADVPPTSPEATVVLTGGASQAHPFSNPVWFPLATATRMGCYRGNPSVGPGPVCRNPTYHTVWAMDIVSATRTIEDPLEPVHPMGAGIVHYGATGQGCGTVPSRGNWVYVDHGNGVLSYYGHLGIILVPDGAYVTPHSIVGTVGNSGYVRCRELPNLRYLFLAVKHGGTNGTYVDIRRMRACQGGAARTWPTELTNNPSGTDHWDVWNEVPSGAPLEAPDASRDCIAPGPPATPDAPLGSSLRRARPHAAIARWTAPAASDRVTRVNVQFQEWHPSIARWLDRENRVLASGTRARFRGLARGRPYRVRVSFANAQGWSAPTDWAVVRAR